MVINLSLDALLLNVQRLKSLDKTPPRDHDSVLKSIWKDKPLDTHGFDWIFHLEDFVSLGRPSRSSLKNFIRKYLGTGTEFLFTVCLFYFLVSPIVLCRYDANDVSL